MEKKLRKNSPKIKINIDNINKKFKIDKKSIKDIVKQVITNEQVSDAEINFIFVDHEYIIQLNSEFLKKDYSTDVLTFPMNEAGSEILSGEIYINLDRVAEQADEYHVTFLNELDRIVIHGCLHLLGLCDYTDQEKKEMTAREDYYLNLIDKEDS
jgi:probable rRNA maturation factor